MRDSFVIHTAYAEKFKRLTDQQFGSLIRVLIAYQSTGAIPNIDDMAVAFAFDVAKVELDIANKKYDAICEQRRQAGSKGGLAKVANASKCKQKVANQASVSIMNNDNDNDNENDNVNDNNNDLHILTNNEVEIINKSKSVNNKTNIHHLVGDDGVGQAYNQEYFDRFWKAYPRKVGKRDVIKIWNRLKPNTDLAEKIINAVYENIERNPQWQKNNGQYIPHPSTWLNQGRWEDDLSTVEHEDYFTRELKKMGGLNFD